MINDAHMKLGSWDLQLRPSAPLDVKKAVKFGGVVFITPTPIGLDGGISTPSLARVKSSAVWAGMVTRRAVRRGRYKGCSLLGFLASGKGSSTYYAAGVTTPLAPPFTFGLWVLGTMPQNGIFHGTQFSPATGWINASDYARSPGYKSALDTLAVQSGNEYRVRPDGGLDYGQPLAVVAPPRLADPSPGLFKIRQVVISPEFDQSTIAGDWWLLRPRTWDPDASIDSYRNYGVIENATGGGYYGRAANDAQRVTFRKYAGVTDAEFRNSDGIQGLSDDVADLNNLGDAVANRFATPQYSISCSVDVTCIPRLCLPGDSVVVYDPIEGLTSSVVVPTPAGQIGAYGIRLYGYSWPITRGLGVYVYDAHDTSKVIDLTPHVEWESGPTKLQLGSPPVWSVPVAQRKLVD
jgi:hypothetical protein